MICIFNPEHDLCLANGGAHYVAPASALRFARLGASIMQVLYPQATALSAAQVDAAFVARWLSERGTPSAAAIVPWGWNITLATSLLKAGVPPECLPDAHTLARWRALQHRQTLLPLQPDTRLIHSAGQAAALFALRPHWVLKAPWSGSGRGLRWVSGGLTPLDRRWIAKVLAQQQCVVAEPRREVAADFALEYRVVHGRLLFVGYSLFRSRHGVYRSNLLLSDAEIAHRVGITPQLQSHIEHWLQATIAPHYEGPLGVDCMLAASGEIHVGELNLRHTMGLVAHQYLAAHPEAEGRRLQLADGRVSVS